MEREDVMERAAGPTIEVVRGIRSDQLDAATPCEDFRVARLIQHLRFWAPSLAGAAHRREMPPPAAAESEVDLTDWHARLEADLKQVASAWSDPVAWGGETRLGGPDPVPATMIGGMACTELVVHGWDLARATDQKPVWDDEVVTFAFSELVATAELGRQMGAYGPEVAVPREAPTLDRALGLTGRDPAWLPRLA